MNGKFSILREFFTHLTRKIDGQFEIQVEDFVLFVIINKNLLIPNLTEFNVEINSFSTEIDFHNKF